MGLPFRLPSERTDYLSTEGETTWAGEFDQELPSSDPESFPELISIAFAARQAVPGRAGPTGRTGTVRCSPPRPPVTSTRRCGSRT